MATKYEHVLRELSTRISQMKRGDQLPTEAMLREEFGVSGMTIRRALQTLIEAKRIVGIRGRGTFVIAPTVTKNMALSSFTESMRAAGMAARSETVSVKMDAGDDESRASLGIDDGQMIYTVTRIRFGDDLPMCLDTAYLPANRYPGLLGNSLNGSLFELLEKQYGETLSRSQHRISAVALTAEEAALLQGAEGDPALRFRTETRGEGSVVACYTVSTYRGDVYEVAVDSPAS